VNSVPEGGPGRRRHVLHPSSLSVASKARDALPVVHVVGLPQPDLAVVAGRGHDRAGRVPAHAPHGRGVVAKVAGKADLKRGIIRFRALNVINLGRNSPYSYQNFIWILVPVSRTCFFSTLQDIPEN
jgi:hypothetical protein